MKTLLGALWIIVSAALATATPTLPIELDFAAIPPETPYSLDLGYGYEAIEERAADNEGTDARLFSIKVPEGNYRVSLTLAPSTTVKAESRRLMLEPVTGAAADCLTRYFFVNVRTAALPPPKPNAPGGESVRIKKGEATTFTWDEKLTLEFSESTVCRLRIEAAPDNLPTVFLIGDSTVTDQASEDYASWGQMLPRFLPKIAVANHAHSGETIKSSLSALRIAKVLSQIKAGDWLLIQFGHNDQKAQWQQTYLAADSTYPAYLRVLVAEAREHGATPVLVTSVQRRNFDETGKIINTHGDYPQALRDLAAAEGIALIDLEKLSRKFYEGLGPERSALAFAQTGKDRSHHNNYGAYVLALFVAQQLRELDSSLEIAAPTSGYPPPEAFTLAASPQRAKKPPEGN